MDDIDAIAWQHLPYENAVSTLLQAAQDYATQGGDVVFSIDSAGKHDWLLAYSLSRIASGVDPLDETLQALRSALGGC